MKATKFFGAIAALAAALCMFSCTDVNNTTTSAKLDPPVVSAKAWPGVNIITWTAVPAAASYNVYKDGNAPVNQTALSFSDINIVNGQSHKYTVEAVFSLKSEANVIGTATTVYLTGIRPPAGTSADDALNLAAYESGSDGSTRKTADQTNIHYLTGDRISGYAGNGVICAEFPAKPYLKYTVEAALASDPTYSGEIVMQDLFLTDQNYKLGGSVLPILKGGTWNINVTAESLNQAYRPSAPVAAASSITIEDLGVAATNSLTAIYTSASNVRLAWIPAIESGSTPYATNCYAVYRQSVDAATGMKSWTQVSGTVTKATIAKGVVGVEKSYYYIDDAAASGTADLVYALVISKNYKYGDAANKTVPPHAGSSMALSLTAPSALPGKVSANAGSSAVGESYDVYYVQYEGAATDDPFLAGITTQKTWIKVNVAEADATAPGATTKTFVVKGDTTLELDAGTYLFRLRVRNGNKEQTSYQFITLQ